MRALDAFLLLYLGACCLALPVLVVVAFVQLMLR